MFDVRHAPLLFSHIVHKNIHAALCVAIHRIGVHIPAYENRHIPKHLIRFCQRIAQLGLTLLRRGPVFQVQANEPIDSGTLKRLMPTEALDPQAVMKLVAQKNTSWKLTPDMRLSRAFAGNERDRRLDVARQALGALVDNLPSA